MAAIARTKAPRALPPSRYPRQELFSSSQRTWSPSYASYKTAGVTATLAIVEALNARRIRTARGGE